MTGNITKMLVTLPIPRIPSGSPVRPLALAVHRRAQLTLTEWFVEVHPRDPIGLLRHAECRRDWLQLPQALQRRAEGISPEHTAGTVFPSAVGTSHQTRHCGTKRKHTKRNAKRASRHLQVLGGPESHCLSVYRCSYCHCWHVGHNRRRVSG